MTALPDGAYAAALATVEGLGSAALARLLRSAESAEALWRELRHGHPRDAEGAWRRGSSSVDVADLWRRHRRHGVGAVSLAAADYPSALSSDPGAPGVLFHRGELPVLGPYARVAVVGTRRPTRYGLGVASQLGQELAAARVSVVSGLAPGIDGAAHEGASAGATAGDGTGGPPVAVVAGGLERAHPAQHRSLYERVAAAGLLLSPVPVGCPVARWQFPARNRLVAALAHVVVVVEAHQGGGTLLTAQAAVDRAVLVGAVPGSVRSPASAGSNDLLADGAFVVRDVVDVLAALSLATAGQRLATSPSPSPAPPPPTGGR